MAYATKDDIEKIYGTQILKVLTDPTNSGEIDEDMVTAALAGASAEIDGYISGRYKTPVDEDEVTPYLKQMCVDMAAYRMALDEAPRTEEMRRRYEDARNFLLEVARGTFDLPGLSQTGDSGSADPGSKTRILTARRC